MNYNPPIKVKVYWNLHKKCFSIQHKGIVIAHQTEVYLACPAFLVSEAGRQRVLRTLKKNVHAFVTGIWCPGLKPLDDEDMTKATRVTYNPYRFSTFVKMEDGNPVDSNQYYAAWMRKNDAKKSPEIYALPRRTP